LICSNFIADFYICDTVISRMVNALRQAIEKVSALPEAAQERIGEELLLHVDKVHRLRSQLENAGHSLDDGGGRALEMTEVIKRARARYGQV
jgi:hypothetical protein